MLNHLLKKNQAVLQWPDSAEGMGLVSGWLIMTTKLDSFISVSFQPFWRTSHRETHMEDSHLHAQSRSSGRVQGRVNEVP
jgi:hypothetical protein